MSYNDDKEYLDFLLRNKIYLSTENFKRNHRLPVNVLGNQNWDLINKTFEKDRVVVVDNFLENGYAERLRNFLLHINFFDDVYIDYAAIDYHNKPNQNWFPLLTNITEELPEKVPFLKDRKFNRAWSFIYDTISNGVGAHADPASININLWVTPNDCMNLQDGYNGLDIWPIKPPESWDWNDYNRNPSKISEFLSKNDVRKLNVEYNFNRAIFFDSMYFHKSNTVSTKPGYENRRINYTFLYD